ncbi:primase-helicase [Bodo saltans virus]|uniref:Primase-helicase n=1 Tax=Bodo saltans virus TaxID=2024608 RepID=A0A2H4UVX3_9VIRU|nr:primase-helicase [Bodo saltans virus]ATZ81016.1 primase-helicase [Bodo saltans virus]
MDNEIKKYSEKKLISFSVNIGQKYNEKQQKWKKELTMPPRWQKLLESKHIKTYNGIALLTGEKNKIIVVDIDNIEHWKKLLDEYDEIEPKTVKVESGSGGVHLYFKYTDEFENITSTDHKFGKEYDIDLKTNGGCIIAPPSTYHNKNLNTVTSYKWINSIYNMEPIEMPKWMKDIIKNPTTTTKKINTKEKITRKKDSDSDSNSDSDSKSDSDLESDFDEEKEISNIDFPEEAIEQLVRMLSKARAEGYSDWINVGMCLYNLDDCYKAIWIEFSKQSSKYDKKEINDKWKTFGSVKKGFGVGSLLKWAKEDNPTEYKKFIDDRKLCKMVVSKFPKENLELGTVTTVSEVCKCIKLFNKKCLIEGNTHEGKPTNYIEMTRDCIALKCSHDNCFGKLLHKQLYMTKQETNMVFNGNNIFNINVKTGSDNSENDICDIEKILIFDDVDLNDLVYAGLCDASTQYANILHYLNKGKYVFTENDTWYVFNERWETEGKKNIDFRKIIDTQLKDLYIKMSNKYIEIEGKTSKTIKYLKRIINKFGDTTLKNNIVTELACNFYDKKFISNLDENYYLIGFDNGVYDLNKFEFRKGTPSDYISMTVGYDYINTYTSKYSELTQFLQDILPNKEEREYILTYISICLIGNQLELFTILTGCGRNGKSKLIELLKYTFGEYFGSVQSQMFTRPRPSAESPDPGLLNLRKKRIVIASEPEKNAKLNSGFIKFITGRDSTTLRNCHSNDMIEFTARFVTLLICNDIPDCDDIDNAFSKRLRCINFPTEFVDKPVKDNQKQINTNINDNFKYWKSDFMLLLIEHFKKYTTVNKLIPSENILKWTNQYKEDTNIFIQFTNIYLMKTDNDDDKIFCSELYDIFKIWFKTTNPHEKAPNDREFNKNLKLYFNVEDSIRIGDKVRRGLRGYILLEE